MAVPERLGGALLSLGSVMVGFSLPVEGTLLAVLGCLWWCLGSNEDRKSEGARLKLCEGVESSLLLVKPSEYSSSSV